jgi:hypothetical protein
MKKIILKFERKFSFLEKIKNFGHTTTEKLKNWNKYHFEIWNGNFHFEFRKNDHTTRGGRFLKWEILFLKFEKKIGHTQPWDDSYAVYIL